MLWYVHTSLICEYGTQLASIAMSFSYCISLQNIVIAATCIDGTIRLMEGESEFEGRLEVCINDRWGTVGSNGWTKIDEQVICNDFGYDLAGKCP